MTSLPSFLRLVHSSTAATHDGSIPAGRLRGRLLALAALAFLAPPPVAAQSAQSSQALKTLTLEDYPKWSRISDVQLSADGRWMSHAYAPNEGDATLHLRALDDTTSHAIPRGSGPVFSKDSRWVAYTINPPGRASGGRGGGGGGRGGVPAQRGQAPQAGSAATPSTLQLLDLQTGAKHDVPDVQSFDFSADSRFLAMRRNRANAQADHQGSDLVVRNLSDGTVHNIGNAGEFAFNKAGALLAWTVDAAGKAGNGVYVMDPANGAMRPLDTDSMRYERLTWNEEGSALVVLRGETPAGQEQRVNTLVAFTGMTNPARPGSRSNTTTLSGDTHRFVYDPASDAAFPKDMVLSELGSVTWSRDDARVFVGIRQQQEKVGQPEGEERANVEVWHWADERLQSVQRVRANADQRATFAAAINLADRRFVRLTDETMARVDITRNGRMAIGHFDEPYRMLFDEPDGLRDLVRINTATGERKTLVERIRFSNGASPDGRWHMYSSGGALWLQNLESGEKTDLSALAGVDFTNTGADRPGEKPTFGVAGWSRDGHSVIVNARFDLWMLPLDGTSKAVNLTGGVGDRDRIQFRVAGAFNGDDDEPGIDTSKPILLSAYGDRTKKSGYFTVRQGREPQALLFEDRSIGQAKKAEKSDRVVFTRQTFEEFPDWWATNTRFTEPRQITDANPQQKEYRWGRRVLVDYTDSRGNDLQATLTLPAGYEAGRTYPMLVYFYEKLSQNHYQYSMPTYDDRPHMSAYASDGYLVLMPDIVYEDGKPGTSALDDVTSAVRKVIELGYADPDHIGAQGHSWGGYESSFIVTQTEMFAAVVTGAPLTNLESMHNILYKQTGGGNAALIQWGQGRMGTVPWRDPEGYASQSPVRFVENITTPFLILHGTADGAVDYNQGLEFFIAARRAGKNVILLTYPDEPHHLVRKENQKDFQRRMKEYFDHYLKGSPAPKWMTEGVRYLERGRTVVTDGNNNNR